MRKRMAEINVVPYIDVMLVLLIIFMVTVPLIQQGVEVDLPRASTKTIESSEAPDPFIVTIDRQGSVTVNKGPAANQVLTPVALVEQVNLIMRQGQPEVYVRGDRSAQYGDIVTTMVLLQNAGAENIGLITQPVAP